MLLRRWPFLYSFVTGGILYPWCAISYPSPLTIDTTKSRLAPITAVPICIESSMWNPRYISSFDCRAAATHFYINEHVEDHWYEKTEFIAHNVPRPTHTKVLATPRRYVEETCTMTIALLVDVPSLAPEDPFLRTDVVTYGEVWNSVQELLKKCILSDNADDVGSEVVGRNASESSRGGNGRVSYRDSAGWVSLVSATPGPRIAIDSGCDVCV